MLNHQHAARFCNLPLCLFAALAGSAVLFLAAGASAQTTSDWTNPAGGPFNTAGNWSAGVPGAGDTALFNLAAASPYTVTFGSDVTSGELLVRNDDVLFDLDGFTYNLTGFSRIGRDDGDFGTLIITNGTLSNAQGIIADLFGSTGVVTVTGAGSEWISSNTFSVGRQGNGTLNIADGGVVTNTSGNTSVANLSGNSASGIPDSTGAVTVTGAGSRWNNQFLFVGQNGIGTLDVDAGGVVTSVGGGIGRTSTGVVTITDVGSQWINSGDLVVGQNSEGVGTLNIAAGGVVTSVMGNIGQNTGSTGAVTVTGTASQWNNSSDLFVGNAGDGTLDVAAGGVATNAGLGYIGFDAGSTGAVTVTGTGSQWSSSLGIRVGGGRLSTGVGGSGDGTLTISAGGVVTSGDVAGGVDGGGGIVGAFGGSTGVATVTGAGSQWNNSGRLLIGDLGGNGTLNIADGGVVTQAGDAFIGFRTGSTGAVTVTGAGSQWNNSGVLTLGIGGSATTSTLNIADGGVVTNTIGTVGSSLSSAAVATVTGAGSQWNHSSDFFVGLDDTAVGTLNVEGGGVVTNLGGAVIGHASGSTGVVTVTGAGSQWISSFGMRVGAGGNGTLNIADGGVVENGNGFVGNLAGSTGVVKVTGAGSQWNNSINLEVGRVGIGTVTQEAGTVTAINVFLGSAGGDGVYNLQGGTLTADSVRVFSVNDQFNFTGGTLRTSNFIGDLTNAGGTFAPGMSPALTNINGHYTQSATSTLEIELGGLLSGEFDQVVIAGDATLDGLLDVQLFGSFTPTSGDEFEILDVAGTRSGQFLGLGEGALVGNFGGEFLFISYATGDGNDVALFTAALPGDFNGDDDVDGADFLLWQRGGSPNPLSASDLADWEANYGNVAPLLASSQAVPEPSSLALLAFGLLGLGRKQRRIATE